MDAEHVLAFRFARSGLARRDVRNLAEAARWRASDFSRDAAIQALAPRDVALYGRALIATEDDELGVQLGRQLRWLAAEKGVSPTDALAEVAEATKGALRDGRALSKNELHDELRKRVSADLMPWCKGCKSHHVAPMLWRYGAVRAGARLDSARRYLLGRPGPTPTASDVVIGLRETEERELRRRSAP